MTHSEIRKQYLKSVAKINNITTPDKLMELPALAVKDIDEDMGNREFRDIVAEIVRDSKANNPPLPPDQVTSENKNNIKI